MLKFWYDSGIKVNPAAPNKAPAEKEINEHSFLWSSLIKNNSPAPDTEEITAIKDLIIISGSIVPKSDYESRKGNTFLSIITIYT